MDRIIENNKVTLWIGNEAYEKIKNGAEVVVESPCKEPFTLRDEKKICRYCTEDFDGYYKPLDKNAHLCVFDTPHEKYIRVDWYGHSMKVKINYCPMCGRKLK